MGRGLMVASRWVTACVVVVGIAAVGDCLAKEDKRATGGTSFGSFGSSSSTSTATKRADPPAAPSRQAAPAAAPAPAAAVVRQPTPAAAPVAQARSVAPQAAPTGAAPLSGAGKQAGLDTVAKDASKAGAKAAGATTVPFGQFGPATKSGGDSAAAERAGPGSLLSEAAPGQAVRRQSATNMALESAAKQAEALRTLDARRSEAVAVGAAAQARVDETQGSLGAVRRGGSVAEQARSGMDAPVRHVPQPLPYPGQGTVYVERTNGDEFARGVAIGRAMRPPVVVRDSGGSSADWVEPSAPVSVPAAPATTDAPALPARGEGADVRSRQDANEDSFPWGTVLGLLLLGGMAVAVVMWMVRARPAVQKKRYSL